MRALALILAAATALAPLPAHASTILFQSVPDLSAQGDLGDWCSSCSGDYQVYDTFSLSTDSSITGVTFNVGTRYWPADFLVQFYQGTADALGAQIASYSFAADGGVDHGNGVTSLSGLLPGLSLASGTYAISFYAATDFVGLPVYSSGSGQAMQYYSGFPNSGFPPYASLGFALEGSAVPEPATWALMLVGFGAVGFSIRRRRTQTHLTQFA